MRWCLLLLAGCAPSASASPSPDAGTEPTWNEVAPIVAAKCAGCHASGGMAPFALTTFEDAKARHSAIAQAVATKRMPPWLPDESCRPHLFARTLTAAEIDTVVRWSTAGALRGEPKPTPEPAPKRDLAWIDRTLDIGVDWVPSPAQGSLDEWRCFAIDPELAADVLAVGYDLDPTVRSQVHHVGIVEAPLADAMAMDDSTPGAGWPCFGNVGVGGGRVVATWAPGFDAVQYPPTTAMRLHAGAALVMQIHYHLHDGVPAQADRTRLAIQLARGSVQHELEFLEVNQAPTIPPHAVDFPLEVSTTIRGRIWGTEPHMHLKGARFLMQTRDACVLDIPRWDYRWEEMNFFEKPLELSTGTTVTARCVWNNPTDETIVNGFGIDNEMCSLGLMVSD